MPVQEPIFKLNAKIIRYMYIISYDYLTTVTSMFNRFNNCCIITCTPDCIRFFQSVGVIALYSKYIPDTQGLYSILTETTLDKKCEQPHVINNQNYNHLFHCIEVRNKHEFLTLFALWPGTYLWLRYYIKWYFPLFIKYHFFNSLKSFDTLYSHIFSPYVLKCNNFCIPNGKLAKHFEN